MEWMIRYKAYTTGNWEIPENDLTSFQEQYNLYIQSNRQIPNSYAAILHRIVANYPNVGLVHDTTYGNGQAVQKYDRIEQLIGQGTPCITTIRLSISDRAHIVPVTEVRPDEIDVIWNITASGHQDIRPFSKADLYQMHNAGRGTAFMYLP